MYGNAAPRLTIAALLLMVGALLGSCRKPNQATSAAPAPVAARRPATPAPAPPIIDTPAPRGKPLTIMYSSNILGEYEPCG